MPVTDVVIEDLLKAEEDLEDFEADEALAEVDDTPEDPTLEASAATERTGIDEGRPTMAAPDEELAMPDAGPGFVNIGNILGVQLFYERENPGPRQFPVASSFRPTLEAIVKQVQERAPAEFGPLRRISTAGLHVVKPGAHGLGRACDWDRLTFGNLQIAPIERDHKSPSRAKRLRYWAFGAICRSNCSFVLHGLFNADHEDHFHTDDVTGVGFNRQSEATVKLLQAVLNEIFGQTPKLATDGVFGEKSKAAFADAMAQLQLTGSIDNVDVWRRFLRRSARLGFVRSLNT